jgi:uracil-DNA glycosylase
MRITFMGQAPSRETDGKPPFTGKCGKFLAELMGTTQEQMLLDHDFLNVLDRWPGASIKGDKFPIPEAKIAARKKLEQLRGRVVVLLGHNVARAFGCEKFQYFQWYEIRNPENFEDVVVPLLTVVPHPSQVNRWWNREESRMVAEKFLRTLADSDKEKRGTM